MRLKHRKPLILTVTKSQSIKDIKVEVTLLVDLADVARYIIIRVFLPSLCESSTMAEN
jgi:hypothetical protein